MNKWWEHFLYWRYIRASSVLWWCVIRDWCFLCLYLCVFLLEKKIFGLLWNNTHFFYLFFPLFLCFSHLLSSLFHCCDIMSGCVPFMCHFLPHESEPIPLPLTAQLLMYCSLLLFPKASLILLMIPHFRTYFSSSCVSIMQQHFGPSF